MFYKVLGVKSRATIDEIKSAYRSKALKLHPDRPGGSHELFQSIQEAYEVLSCESKRKEYDESIKQEKNRMKGFFRPAPLESVVSPVSWRLANGEIYIFEAAPAKLRTTLRYGDIISMNDKRGSFIGLASDDFFYWCIDGEEFARRLCASGSTFATSSIEVIFRANASLGSNFYKRTADGKKHRCAPGASRSPMTSTLKKKKDEGGASAATRLREEIQRRSRLAGIEKSLKLIDTAEETARDLIRQDYDNFASSIGKLSSETNTLFHAAIATRDKRIREESTVLQATAKVNSESYSINQSNELNNFDAPFDHDLNENPHSVCENTISPPKSEDDTASVHSNSSSIFKMEVKLQKIKIKATEPLFASQIFPITDTASFSPMNDCDNLSFSLSLSDSIEGDLSIETEKTMSPISKSSNRSSRRESEIYPEESIQEYASLKRLESGASSDHEVDAQIPLQSIPSDETPREEPFMLIHTDNKISNDLPLSPHIPKTFSPSPYTDIDVPYYSENVNFQEEEAKKMPTEAACATEKVLPEADTLIDSPLEANAPNSMTNRSELPQSDPCILHSDIKTVIAANHSKARRLRDEWNGKSVSELFEEEKAFMDKMLNGGRKSVPRRKKM